MKDHIVRLLLVVATLTIAAGIGAAQPERPPKGHGKYLIVLWEPGTPIPGKKDERMKRVPEPDIAKLGGRLLAKQANRRVVFLPYGIAKQLRRHEAVSFVQRIWTGEPFSEWNEGEIGGDTALRSPDVAVDTAPTFTWEKSYEYDADGNITDIGADQFEYDDLGRLTAAVVNGAAQAYFYDSFGNLTGTSWPGGGVSVPTDPGTNRMTGHTYDAAGNVTSRKDRGTYEYDSLNMIVKYEALPQIGKRRILYDANDERIGTIIDSSLQRWTIRDFDGQILREFSGYDNGLNLVWSWEQDHIRGDGQLIAGETQQFGYMYEQSPEPAFLYGGKRHYHLDHLGSVRVVTNAAGAAISENDFFPFGREATKRYQEQLNQGQYHTDGMRFAGHWRDNMGHPEVEDDEYLDYMHARYYDPNLGRFLSPDPILGNLLQPQSWNRYAYVFNNPVTFLDPLGLAARKPGERVDEGDTCEGKVVDGWCTATVSETIKVEAKAPRIRLWIAAKSDAAVHELQNWTYLEARDFVAAYDISRKPCKGYWERVRDNILNANMVNRGGLGPRNIPQAIGLAGASKYAAQATGLPTWGQALMARGGMLVHGQALSQFEAVVAARAGGTLHSTMIFFAFEGGIGVGSLANAAWQHGCFD